MSSILRALKKLDEDAMPLEDRTGEHQPNLRQMVNRRARGPRFKARFLFISLSVVVIALAAIAALIFIRPAPEPEPEPYTAKKAELLTTAPIAAAQPQPIPQPPTPGKEPVQQAVKTELVAGPTPSPIPLQQPQPTAITPALPSPQVIGQKPAAKPIVQPTRPQLTLHGILWSDKTDRRVALIGEKYLKEGDVINGATIIKIEKKSVTLQLGEDSWTIRVN